MGLPKDGVRTMMTMTCAYYCDEALDSVRWRRLAGEYLCRECWADAQMGIMPW